MHIQAAIGLVCVIAGLALALPTSPDATEVHDGVVYRVMSPNITINGTPAKVRSESMVLLPICRADDFVEECLADPECKNKFVIHQVEMTLKMQDAVKKNALEAFAVATNRTDIANINLDAIANLLKLKQNVIEGLWNCIVAKSQPDFGFWVYFEKHYYITFTLGPWKVLLWKYH